MNDERLSDPAYYFPFCALAAHYKEGAFIEDAILDPHHGWLPGATVHRFWHEETLDFSYAIEHGGWLLIVSLGTEGGLFGPGWKSDLSPQIEMPEFKKLGGHVDFIQAGQRVADHFRDLIIAYGMTVVQIGHSRGAAEAIAGAWRINRLGGDLPSRVISYCGPAVFDHETSDVYDKSGLGGATIRMTMHHDPVDLAGLPFLKHVGTELPMPNIETTAEKAHGIVGQIAYGHAYSSVFECLIEYHKQRGELREVKYLEDRKWVCTV